MTDEKKGKSKIRLISEITGLITAITALVVGLNSLFKAISPSGKGKIECLAKDIKELKISIFVYEKPGDFLEENKIRFDKAEKIRQEIINGPDYNVSGAIADNFQGFHKPDKLMVKYPQCLDKNDDTLSNIIKILENEGFSEGNKLFLNRWSDETITELIEIQFH